jgi:alanyl-tRNA synthetase
LHLVQIEEGYLKVGDKVSSQVDEKRRFDIARNHTSTHLLHRALKDLLGEHVNQAGSLVAPDRLRFDFTHFSGLDAEEIEKIEENVNTLLRENLPVETSYTELDKALEIGAVALFDEKYSGRGKACAYRQIILLNSAAEHMLDKPEK